jgi:hypothetical protein
MHAMQLVHQHVCEDVKPETLAWVVRSVMAGDFVVGKMLWNRGAGALVRSSYKSRRVI